LKWLPHDVFLAEVWRVGAAGVEHLKVVTAKIGTDTKKEGCRTSSSTNSSAILRVIGSKNGGCGIVWIVSVRVIPVLQDSAYRQPRRHRHSEGVKDLTHPLSLVLRGSVNVRFSCKEKRSPHRREINYKYCQTKVRVVPGKGSNDNQSNQASTKKHGAVKLRGPRVQPSFHHNFAEKYLTVAIGNGGCTQRGCVIVRFYCAT